MISSLPGTPRRLQTAAQAPATAEPKRVQPTTSRRHSFSGSTSEGTSNGDVVDAAETSEEPTPPPPVKLVVELTPDSSFSSCDTSTEPVKEPAKGNAERSSVPRTGIHDHKPVRSATAGARTSPVESIDRQPLPSRPINHAPPTQSYPRTSTGPSHPAQHHPHDRNAHAHVYFPPGFIPHDYIDPSSFLAPTPFHSRAVSYASPYSGEPVGPDLQHFDFHSFALPSPTIRDYPTASHEPWLDMYGPVYYPINGQTGAYQQATYGEPFSHHAAPSVAHNVSAASTSSAIPPPTYLYPQAHLPTGQQNGLGLVVPDLPQRADGAWASTESSTQSKLFSGGVSHEQILDYPVLLPARPPGPSIVDQLDQGAILRRTGTTKFFDLQKGFGFILDDRIFELEGRDIFVHYTAILMKHGFRCLHPEEEVEYDLVKVTSGGYQALNVTGAHGAKLKGLDSAEPRKSFLSRKSSESPDERLSSPDSARSPTLSNSRSLVPHAVTLGPRFKSSPTVGQHMPRSHAIPILPVSTIQTPTV